MIHEQMLRREGFSVAGGNHELWRKGHIQGMYSHPMLLRKL